MCRTKESSSNGIRRPEGCVISSVSRSTVSSFSDATAALILASSASGSCDRRDPGLGRVRPEDVSEARRQHDPEAVVLERPGGVLAGGAAAEVAPATRIDAPCVLRPPQLERGILHPVVEEELAVPRALDPLQELLRDDLVGVDIGALEHRGPAGDLTNSSAPSRRQAVPDQLPDVGEVARDARRPRPSPG